jgi:hypothetical protein
MVGFVGFEMLRLYKRLWRGGKKKAAPLDNVTLYCIILSFVGLFSGCVASAFAGPNPLLALYVGFSIPTNAKAILNGTARKSDNADDNVDDVELREPRFGDQVRLAVWDYFAW